LLPPVRELCAGHAGVKNPLELVFGIFEKQRPAQQQGGNRPALDALFNPPYSRALTKNKEGERFIL
jgi:hypothetical protein